MAPFQLIKFIDSNRDFGQVYYGHQIPESVELIREIPSQETKGIVYKNEEEGKIIAEEYLKKFKIQLDYIEYKGIDNEYRDEYLHLVYTPKNLEKDIFVFGDVSITLGENGKLISVEDKRIYNEFYKEVELISPKDSIDIATNVGVGTIACKAFVSSIEPDYYYNEKTGYLIPTWSIVGEMKNKNGDTYSWNPNIEAIKK